MVGPNDVFARAHIVIEPFVTKMSHILAQRATPEIARKRESLWTDDCAHTRVRQAGSIDSIVLPVVRSYS